MKTSVKNLKEMLFNVFKEGYEKDESVSRSKRARERGRKGEPGGDESGVSYDVFGPPAGEVEEGVSQSKRSRHGYDLEEPDDYDTPGEGTSTKGIGESIEDITEAPPPPRSGAPSSELTTVVHVINKLLDKPDLSPQELGDLQWVARAIVSKVQQRKTTGPTEPMEPKEPTATGMEPSKVAKLGTRQFGRLKGSQASQLKRALAGEVNDPPAEPKKKREKGMGHAAERGHKAEVPFGVGEEKEYQEGKLSAEEEKLYKALKDKPGIDEPVALAKWMAKKGHLKKERAMPSLGETIKKKK
jgi:hypothetical protein